MDRKLPEPLTAASLTLTADLLYDSVCAHATSRALDPHGAASSQPSSKKNPSGGTFSPLLTASSMKNKQLEIAAAYLPLCIASKLSKQQLSES